MSQMSIMYHMYPCVVCMSCTLTSVICMEESIKEGGKKEIGFAKLRNQASFVLIKKLIKKRFVIHLMYLISQI